MESFTYKNNLIFVRLKVNNDEKNKEKQYKQKLYGFLDTGGGQTFIFRKHQLIKHIKITQKYMETEELEYLPKNVIVFIGQDYFKNKIIEFNYLKQSVIEMKPTQLKKQLNNKSFGIKNAKHNHKKYEMIKSSKNNFIHVDIIFENKKHRFLFDTGATTTRNNKNSVKNDTANYAISFLDGIVFDKLAKKYNIEKNYDQDGSPAMTIQEITIFDKKIRNVKFLRREKGAFSWMSKITGIKHMGAIGGNVLKHFSIICDYKSKAFYVEQ